MNKRYGNLVQRLGAFTLTLGVAVYCYYLFSPVYGRIVLTLSGLLFQLFSQAPAIVSFSESQGILVMSPSFQGTMVFKYDLFSICLNVIFAPALVVMTTGWRGWGWLRIMIAVFIMIMLHAGEVVITLLRFLTETSNPLIPAVPKTVAAASKWVYTFVDKMGYTLFPFMAWLIVCAGELARWASAGVSVDKQAPGTPSAEAPRHEDRQAT